jgi:hypothetical protein
MNEAKHAFVYASMDFIAQVILKREPGIFSILIPQGYVEILTVSLDEHLEIFICGIKAVVEYIEDWLVINFQKKIAWQYPCIKGRTFFIHYLYYHRMGLFVLLVLWHNTLFYIIKQYKTRNGVSSALSALSAQTVQSAKPAHTLTKTSGGFALQLSSSPIG